MISGGSSGIGLAIARLLAASGHQLVLIARGQARLEAARASFGAASARVTILPLDVTDEAASAAAIAAIMAQYGRIDWLFTAAGSVEPGLFADLPREIHAREMAVNYFGTLNLLVPVMPLMRAQGSGRIVMIASGAAFLGVPGYSAYCPAKAAIAALAETLHVELAGDGIAVSVAFPPDTDTPQWREEQVKRPEITRLIAAEGGVMSAERVARAIVQGALARRLVISPGLAMTFFAWLHPLLAPILRWRQLRLLRRLAGDGPTTRL